MEYAGRRSADLEAELRTSFELGVSALPVAQLSTRNPQPLACFHGPLACGVVKRTPGSLQAHAGTLGQPAAPETNIGLTAKEDSGWRIEDGKILLGPRLLCRHKQSCQECPACRVYLISVMWCV